MVTTVMLEQIQTLQMRNVISATTVLLEQMCKSQSSKRFRQDRHWLRHWLG